MLSASRQLELSMFAKVWQSPYLDLFKSAQVYESKCVRLVGNVEQVLDSELGKRVFNIKGAVSASNFIEIPGPEKRAAGVDSSSASRSLGLTGKYVYFQLRSVTGSFFAIHLDLVTSTGLGIRLSLSNIYKSMKVLNNGRVVQVPVSFLNDGRWSVLAVHIPSVLEEAHAIEIKSRQNSNSNNPGLTIAAGSDNRPKTSSSLNSLAGPAAFDYSFIKSVQVCAALAIRTIATSNQRFSIGTLPRELRFPINGGNWDDHYDWFWLGSPPPLDSAEVAAVKKLTNKPHARVLANQDINIAQNSRAPVSIPSTSSHMPNHDTESASVGQENRRPRSSDSILSPDPILELYKIVGFTPRMTRNLSFSPDGQFMVYPSGNIIIVSDVKSGAQRFLTGHTAAVNLIQFSNSGKILASGQEGKQPVIRLWNYETGQTFGCLMAHTSDLKSVAFNADDSLIAAVGKDGTSRQTIVIWEITQIEAGKAVIIAKQTSEYSIQKILFSPFREESTNLISCGHENIRFWRLKNRHLNGSSLLLNEHARNSFTDMAFESRFGAADQMSKRLFISTTSGSVFQVNYHDRVLECIFKLHSGPINSIAINEGFCVTGSEDSFLRVWPLDFSDFYLQAQHKGSIVGVDISMDGLHVMVGTAGGCVGILDLTSTAYQTRIRSHLDSIFCVAFDPQRDEFATVSKDGTIRIWGLHSLEQIYEFYSPHESVISVAYHPDPKEYRLACGFSSGSMRVMDVASTSMFVDYQQHTGRVLDLVFSKSGKYLYSNGEEGNICCYDVERNYLPIKMFTTYRNNSFALAPRPAIAGLNASARKGADAASPYLAFANASATGNAAAVKSDVLNSPLPPHALAISPDDSLLATIGADPNSVVLFECPSFRQLRTFHSGFAPISSIRFNPSESEICLILSDSTYQRFSLQTGEMISHIRPTSQLKFKPEKQIKEKTSGIVAVQNPLQPRALSATLSPHANFLFVATSEPVLRVFDYYSADPVNAESQSFSCHGDSAISPASGTGIYSLETSQDGKFVVSVGGESVWIWRFRGSEKSPAQAEMVRVEENQRRERERIAAEEREKNFEEYYDEETGEIRLRRRRTQEELENEEGKEEKSDEVKEIPAEETAVLSRVQFRPSRSNDLPMRSFTNNPLSALRPFSVLGFGGRGRSNLVWNPTGGFFAYSVGHLVVHQKVSSQSLGESKSAAQPAGRTPIILDRHTTEVSTLALSGDGNFLASAASTSSRDREFTRVWDLREPGKCASTLYFDDEDSSEFHSFGSQAICFDPSGTLLITISTFVPGRGSLIAVWHWNSRRCIARKIQSQPTHGLKWISASSPIVGISAPAAPSLAVEKFLMIERAHFLTWGCGGIHAHALSGSEIASRQWLAASECGADVTEIHSLDMAAIHGKPAISIGTRCGQLLMLDSNANLLHRSTVVDSASGEEIVSIQNLSQGRLSIASSNGAVQQYSLEPSEGGQIIVSPHKTVQFHSYPCALALDPAGSVGLVGTSDGSIWFSNFVRDQKVRLVASSTEFVNQVAFTPNRKFVSAVADDGSLRVFLLSNNGASSIVHYQVSGAACLAVAHHPTLEEISASYSDGSIRVLELSSLTVKRSIKLPSAAAINALAYVNDGRTLIGGTATGFVFAVAVELSLVVPSTPPTAQSAVSPHSAHIGDAIDSITVSPFDSSVWLITDRRRNVSIWRSRWFAGDSTNWKGFLNENSHQLLGFVQSTGELSQSNEFSSIPTCAIFSSTRQELVFLANFAAPIPTLIVFDFTKSAQVAKLQIAAWPTAMAISHDGALIAVGDASRLLTVYEIADSLSAESVQSTRLPVLSVVTHSGSVGSVSFAPDSNKKEYLLASASEGLIRLSAIKKASEE